MIIIAHNYFKPDNVDKALPILERLVQASRKENGCNGYDLCRDMQDPTHFVIMENWASEEAMTAHSKQPHFIETVGNMVPLMAKEGAITVLDKVDIC